jgi:hypothetical protein
VATVNNSRNSNLCDAGPGHDLWSAAGCHSLKATKILGTLVIAAMLGGVAGDAGATVLIFDQTRDATTSTMVFPTYGGSNVQQDYGDRVTGSPMAVPGGMFTYGNGGEGFTPNVVAEYSSGNNISLWTTDYGDLTNVMFALQNSNVMNILLTADSGFDVLLYDFDLAGWPQSDYTIDEVAVLSGGTPLFAQNGVLVEGDATGPGHTTVAFANPLRGPELLIKIDFSNIGGSIQDNIGIDNIRFGQDPPPAAIPAPAVLPLLFSALGVLGFAGWRKQNTA